jgi:hypothetical protein
MNIPPGPLGTSLHVYARPTRQLARPAILARRAHRDEPRPCIEAEASQQRSRRTDLKQRGRPGWQERRRRVRLRAS